MLGAGGLQEVEAEWGRAGGSVCQGQARCQIWSWERGGGTGVAGANAHGTAAGVAARSSARTRRIPRRGRRPISHAPLLDGIRWAGVEHVVEMEDVVHTELPLGEGGGKRPLGRSRPSGAICRHRLGASLGPFGLGWRGLPLAAMSVVPSPKKSGVGTLPPSKETNEMRFEDFRVRALNPPAPLHYTRRFQGLATLVAMTLTSRGKRC